jgi:hypothetical protein
MLLKHISYFIFSSIERDISQQDDSIAALFFLKWAQNNTILVLD